MPFVSRITFIPQFFLQQKWSDSRALPSGLNVKKFLYRFTILSKKLKCAFRGKACIGSVGPVLAVARKGIASNKIVICFAFIISFIIIINY